MQLRPSNGARPIRRASEAVLWAAAIALPLMLGGVGPEAQMVALAASALALALAARGQRGPWRVPALGRVLLALAAYEALQVLPLPGGLLGLVSPRAWSTWTGALGEVRWAPLSVDPPATVREAGKALAVALTFIAAARLGESRRARTRLAAAVAVSGGVAALAGFIHRLAGAEAIYGRWPTHGVLGQFAAPFVNPNHMATLLALSTCAAVGLAVAGKDRQSRAAWLLLAVVCAAGCLLTLSRGGAVALLSGLVALGAIVTRGTETAVRRPRAWMVPAAALFAMAVAAYLAYDRIARDARASPGAAQLKIAPWAPAWRMALDHPLTGAGRGAFALAHAAYKTTPVRTSFTHVENEPLELAAEVGFVWAGAVLAALAATMLAAARRRGDRPADAGLLAGVMAVAIHSCAEFSVELVGVSFPCALALGALAAPVRGDGPAPGWVRRPAPAAAVLVGLLGMAGVSWAALRDPDLALEALRAAAPAEVPALAREAMRLHPADALLPLMAGARSTQVDPAAAVRFLDRARVLAPSSPDPHLHLARALMAAGARKQALGQVRLALAKGAERRDGVRAALWIGRNMEEWLAAMPGTPEAFGWLSDGLWEAGRRGEANQVALVVAELFGTGGGAAARLARQALDMRDDAAAARWSRIWAAEERAAGAHAVLARALERSGDAESAAAAWQAAIGVGQGDPDITLNYASFLLRHGAPAAARSALERARAGPGEDGILAKLHAMRGQTWKAESQPTRAVAEYRIAARHAPEIPEYRIAAAQILADLGRYAEAAQELSEGISAAPPAARAVLAARLAELQAAVPHK